MTEVNEQDFLGMMLESDPKENRGRTIEEIELEDQNLETEGNSFDKEDSSKVKSEDLLDVKKIESGVPVDFIHDNDEGLPDLKEL